MNLKKQLSLVTLTQQMTMMIWMIFSISKVRMESIHSEKRILIACSFIDSNLDLSVESIDSVDKETAKTSSKK